MIWSYKKSGLLLRKNYIRDKIIALRRIVQKLQIHTPMLWTIYVLVTVWTQNIFQSLWLHFLGSTFQLDCKKARESQRENNLTGEISEKFKEEQINKLIIQIVEEKPRWMKSSHSTWAGFTSQFTNFVLFHQGMQSVFVHERIFEERFTYLLNININ